MAVSEEHRTRRSVRLRPGVLHIECSLRGWTFAKLGELAGIHEMSVGRANRGLPVDRSTFAKLVSALDASPPAVIVASLLGTPNEVAV